MEITVVFYGGLRYDTGARRHQLTMAAESAPVADVLEVLAGTYSSLGPRLAKVAVAVDDEIVDRSFIVHDGAEVSLLPPVSGGAGNKWLSEEPLDLPALLAETEDPTCGGLVIFSGDIRNHNQGRQATAITYDAHHAIAGRVLSEIEAEVLQHFEAAQCRVQHRVGRVEVGQSSVLVIVRAAHRDAAFQGARYAIDELKERTPIWKEEHYAEGDSAFLDGVPLRGRG